MTLNYTARIVGRLPGHAEIELHRFTRKFYPQDWDTQVAHLSPDWEVWLERPLTDHQTLTSRPWTGRRHGPLPSPAVPLKPEENALLEARGVMPAYLT